MDKWLIKSRPLKRKLEETEKESDPRDSSTTKNNNNNNQNDENFANTDSVSVCDDSDADKNYNPSASPADSNSNSETDSESDVDVNVAIIQKKSKKAKKLWKPKLKPTKLVKQFPWIDESKKLPVCKVCNKAITGGVFHIKRHEQSTLHIKNYNAAKNTKKIENIFVDNKLSNSVKRAELKFAAYVCDQNLPFLLMDSLPSLCKDIFPDSNICKDIKIKRKKATELVVDVIAPFFKNEIIDDLKTNNFTIIIDETTDVSAKKSLIILVRYWKQGLMDRILDLVEVNDASAQALFMSIKNILDENKIPYKNMIAFAADNASTMMGDKNGVQAKLKELNPNIYVQGCLCHSLHLCTSAAAKELPSVVEQFVRDIYTYFAHSSKRISELGECQVFANEKPHKMLYPSQTRWLSLKAVVDRVLEQWNPLILFFQRASLEDNLPTAKCIHNALQNPVYKLYLLFLSYVLDLVIKVNIEMQSVGPKAPILLERFTTLYKVLLKNFIKHDMLTDFQKLNINNPRNFLAIENIYCGAKTDAFLEKVIENKKITPNEIDNFKKAILKFYLTLCNQIKNRFNFEDKYLKFASNFAPSNVKKGSTTSVAGFINLFPQIDCDIEQVNTEWKILIEQDFEDYSDDISEFWNKISNIKNSLNEPMFCNLILIVKIILTLPHSSASAERGFSQLSLNKTKIRNRLSVNTLAAILIIKNYMQLHGAVEKWEPPKILINSLKD